MEISNWIRIPAMIVWWFCLDILIIRTAAFFREKGWRVKKEKVEETKEEGQ